MNRIFNRCLLLVVLLLLACMQGNPVVQLKITSDPQSTEIGNALIGDPIEFTKAEIAVRDIRFESAENCDVEDENEFDYDGPFVVNLLNQKSIPSLDQITLTQEKYCKFKFKIDELKDDERPEGVSPDDDLVGYSVFITGVRDEIDPFVLRIEENMEFELESEDEDGFSLVADEINTIFLVFDLTNLFDGVDLEGLDMVDGTIYLDDDHNKDEFEIILDNFKSLIQLQGDKNKNETLDDDDDVIAD